MSGVSFQKFSLPSLLDCFSLGRKSDSGSDDGSNGSDITNLVAFVDLILSHDSFIDLHEINNNSKNVEVSSIFLDAHCL